MSKRLFNLLFNKPEMKSKILIDIDDKEQKADVEIEGTLPNILTAVSLLVSNLKNHNIPKELIKGAVEIGLEEEKTKNKIEVKEIHISKENEEEFKKILDKMLKGE